MSLTPELITDYINQAIAIDADIQIEANVVEPTTGAGPYDYATRLGYLVASQIQSASTERLSTSLDSMSLILSKLIPTNHSLTVSINEDNVILPNSTLYDLNLGYFVKYTGVNSEGLSIIPDGTFIVDYSRIALETEPVTYEYHCKLNRSVLEPLTDVNVIFVHPFNTGNNLSYTGNPIPLSFPNGAAIPFKDIYAPLAYAAMIKVFAEQGNNVDELISKTREKLQGLE